MRFFHLFLFVLLFLNLCENNLADQIVAAHSAGETFGRSSHEPKYTIEFHPLESPFHPDDDQESMVMSNQNGQSFLCFLPKIEEKESGNPIAQQNSSKLVMEAGRRAKLKTPDELMEVLKDRCFYRQEGWWSYEFCYKNVLRQLHLEDKKVVQEFVLGVFDAEATTAFNHNRSDISILKDPRSKDASQRYHAHQYTNGTICDLTNQPREAEVRFVCSEPRVLISSIKEISTCKYAVTIQCPMLCKHPMFQEERPAWHIINCNEMPASSDDAERENRKIKDEQIDVGDNIQIPSSSDLEANAM